MRESAHFMSSSIKRFTVVMGLSAGLIAVVDAQTAFRCDNNGQTVYSDSPCPAGKSVVSTQDSAAQKAAAKDANAQLRADNEALNKRLGDRQKLEAQERAAALKAAGKPVTVAAKVNATGKVAKAKPVKKPKAAKQPRNTKKPKNDALISTAK